MKYIATYDIDHGALDDGREFSLHSTTTREIDRINEKEAYDSAMYFAGIIFISYRPNHETKKTIVNLLSLIDTTSKKEVPFNKSKSTVSFPR